MGIFSRNKDAKEEVEEGHILDFDIDIKLPDEKLNKKFDKAIDVSEKQFAEKKPRWEDNLKLLIGEHDELSGRTKAKLKNDYKSDTIMNMIFPGFRNIVGLMTDSKPQPVVYPAPMPDEGEERQRNEEYAEKLHNIIDQRWDEIKMDLEIPILIFQALTFDDSFLMPYWNVEQDDVSVEVVSPQDVRVYPNVSIEEADFIIIKSKRSYTWLKRAYPNKEAEIRKMVSKNPDNDGQFDLETLFTDNVMIVRVKAQENKESVILDKKPNPFFEFDDEETQAERYRQENPEDEQGQGFKPVTNYFNYPKKPLIQFSTYKTDKGTYSNVSQIGQLEKIQVSMNKRKQQVDDNANAVGNEKMLYDITILSKQEAQKIQGRAGEKIGVKGLAQNPNAIQFVGGKPLPAYIMDDLGHSQKIFDDQLGQHDITRGTKNMTQTLGEAQMMREADQTVVRLLSRSMDVTLGKLVEYWVQLMKLYYTETKYIRSMGEELSAEFNQDMITEGIKIDVRVGTTLPTDKQNRRETTMQLASFDKVAPIDLYKIMEYPDPEGMAERLAEYQGRPTEDQAGQIVAQENVMMAEGQVIPINENEDDHQRHMDGHTAEMLRIGESLPEEVQAIFLEHINQHELIVEDSGQQPQQGGGGQPQPGGQQQQPQPNI